MKIPILAFGHQSRVGKNEACKAIASEKSGDWGRYYRFSFATALKNTCHDMFGHLGLKEGGFYETPAGAALRNTKLEKINKSPVEIWIEVGQAMRAIYPEVWASRILGWPKVLPGQEKVDGLILVSDLRFQNEADLIRELGGWCVKITRPDAPPPRASDNAIDPDFKWDWEITNDGDLGKLKRAACALAETYEDHWQKTNGLEAALASIRVKVSGQLTDYEKKLLKARFGIDLEEGS